jgi:hypothetical protein
MSEQQKEREQEPVAEPEPLKRHGDALMTGTGSRHGVDHSGDHPDICTDEAVPKETAQR